MLRERERLIYLARIIPAVVLLGSCILRVATQNKENAKRLIYLARIIPAVVLLESCILKGATQNKKNAKVATQKN